MDEIAGHAAAQGVNTLWGLAPIVTVLILVIIGLVYFVRALLSDAKEERNLYRQALKENTEAFNNLKEIIRVALSVK